MVDELTNRQDTIGIIIRRYGDVHIFERYSGLFLAFTTWGRPS